MQQRQGRKNFFLRTKPNVYAMPRLVPAGPTGSAPPSGETFLGLEAIHAGHDYQSRPRIVPVLAVCYVRTAHSAGKPSTFFLLVSQ